MTAAASAPVTDAAPARAGRNRVSSRALRRVAEAVAAEAMGVAPRDVSISLADDDGLLGITAATPIAVRGIAPTRRAVRGPSATVLERAEEAQAALRDRMLQLTGSSVGRIDLRITGARLESAS